MGVKIQLLRSTASEWTAKNPTLDAGQPGFEIDTFKLKIGNGSLSWNDLPYISGGFGGNDGPLEYEYDVTMSSNNTIEPSELYFNSLSNNIDFSSYFNDLITNNYTVKLKLTLVNNSNKFLITSCDTINNYPLFGDIDAFWPSRSIKWIIDGGNDQYDSSNYINTNYTYVGIPTESPFSTTLRNISIPYNGGRIAEQSQYWGNNDYVTLYKKSIWAMVAKGNSATMPNTVFYSGNAGADGDGGKDNGTLTNYNGYQAGYARLYGDDPTYTKLIITKTGTTPSYFIDSDNDTNDDLFGASDVNSDTIAMVVFYGSDTTNPSSLSDLQTLFENFVDSVLSGSNVSQIKNNFYNNFNTLYNSVDPGFWYENFEFFTGTNNGLPNTINAEGGSGSGAIFEVTVDQENNQYTISTSAAGINYVVGDIIKIPGSNLQQPDGISPDEDIYVRVDTIDINGGVDTFSSIISINYNFINLTTLAESDGFRFFDNEKYYLNIDIVGLGLDAIDTQIQDALNTSLVAGDGINLDYDGGNQTLTIESTANTKILPGDNVIFNYNSGTDELTISANSITVPNLEDILVEGDGIDLAFDEENNTVTISQESIANYADNRLLTSDGTTTGINAESNLTFNGSQLTVTGDVSASFYFGAFDGPIVLDCKNNTVSTINKGTPVYISGHFANGKVYVAPADASDSAKMPAIGLLGETLTSGQEGHVYILGSLSNINTTAYNDPADIGKVLYVASGGGLTLTRPTGENVLIQNIARIARIHNNGRLIILGAGRTNDVPNSITAYKLDIDNIRIDGNTISSTDTNGDIILTPNGAGQIILGKQNSASDPQELSYANGRFSSDGDARFSSYVLMRTTTSSGLNSLYLDYSTNADSDISITNTTSTFVINISGRASNGDSAGFVVRGCVKNISGAVSLVGSPVIESFLDSNFATANVQILTSGTGLVIQVDQGSSGVSGTIKWVASVQMSRVTY
jgi:hypothetical protein